MGTPLAVIRDINGFTTNELPLSDSIWQVNLANNTTGTLTIPSLDCSCIQRRANGPLIFVKFSIPISTPLWASVNASPVIPSVSTAFDPALTLLVSNGDAFLVEIGDVLYVRNTTGANVALTVSLYVAP